MEVVLWFCRSPWEITLHKHNVTAQWEKEENKERETKKEGETVRGTERESREGEEIRDRRGNEGGWGEGWGEGWGKGKGDKEKDLEEKKRGEGTREDGRVK